MSEYIVRPFTPTEWGNPPAYHFGNAMWCDARRDFCPNSWQCQKDAGCVLLVPAWPPGAGSSIDPATGEPYSVRAGEIIANLRRLGVIA